MTKFIANPRIPETEVDSIFIDRWSPRSFINEPLSDDQVQTLFEAARWSPSCFNEQPWLFPYARSPEDRKRFLTALSEWNQRWAKNAPLLLFACCRKAFTKSGKENRTAAFDTGAAWMALALQARRLGLHAHGMAGFSPETAFDVTGLDRTAYDVMAAIAVGRRDDPEKLAEDMKKNEMPNTRKPHAEVAREGRV
jgi:nitroreductase